MMKQQEADAQAKALIDFTEAIERPFFDLAPHKGDSKAMRQWLIATSVLRRIELAERSGVLATLTPAIRETLLVLRYDLRARQAKAQHRCRRR
jgi:hypothetical protein